MSDLYIEARLQAIKDIASTSCSDIKDADNIASFCDEIYDAIPNLDKIVEELNKLDIKAIKRYKGGTFGDYEGTDYYIKKSDAIEIVKQGGVSDDISREAKQGKWILDEFTAKYGNPYRCSCCNIEFGDTYNYCPNCGASMKEAKQMDEEDFCYCHYHNDTYEYFDCLDYMECEECPYYYADED